MGITVLAASLAAPSLANSPLVIVAVWIVAAIAFRLALESDRGRTLVVFYDLEPGRAPLVFQKILDGFRALRDSSRTELVDSGPVSGDFQQIRATPVNLTLSSRPPGMETNVATPLFSADFRSIYLLPDGVLAFDGRERRATLALYRDLVIDAGRSPVIEATPADDAELVSAGGSRKSVRSLAGANDVSVAMYDWLRLASASSEIALIQVSKPGSAARLTEALQEAGARVTERASETPAPALVALGH